MIPTLASLFAASITMPSCPPPWLDEPELERLVAIETASSARAIELVTLDCERDPHTLQIVITSEGTLIARRTAALSEIAAGVRLRVLALVIGEMIEAPQIEPEAPVPEAPPPLPPPVIEEPEPDRFVSVTGSARYLVDPGTLAFGARLGGSIFFDNAIPWVIWGSLGAEGGYGRVDLGSATLFAATALIGAGLVHRRPGLRLAVGPGLEGGLVMITGATDEPFTFSRATSGTVVVAELEGRVDVAVGEDLWLEVVLGLGGALRGFVGGADSIDLVGIAGPTARLQLGLAFGI
jgi:hypothetical protein